MVRLLEQARRRSTDAELFAGLVPACRYCGLLGPSLRADTRARRLDPSIKTSVIHTHWMLNEHEQVVANTGEAPIVGAFSLLALGRESEALEFLEEKEKKVPAKIQEIIGALRALLQGRQAEAIAGIQAIIASGFRDTEGQFYLARQLARAGGVEEAVGLLERASEAGFWCYPLFTSDDWLDPIRDHPGFARVLDRARREHDLALAAFASAGGDQILGLD
jgi:hypothetical protein